MRHSRRQIVGLAAAGLGAGGLAMLSPALADQLTGFAPGGAGDLSNPTEIRSRNGLLQATLRVTLDKGTIDQKPFMLRQYNGGLPGPTLRASPGDRLEITLINDLPPNPATDGSGGHGQHSATHVAPHDLNTTNLHFHGMHVSPKSDSDNVFLTVEPGTAFNYRVQIPGDHPTGAFWYHPHWHGSVAAQIGTGMAGLILIEPPGFVPPGLPERHMVIQTVIGGLGKDFDDPKKFMSLRSPRTFTINGQYRPTVHLRQGERQFWRLLLANDFQFCPLDFTAMGLKATLVGRDGIPLAKPRDVESLFLSPGNRFDVVVVGSTPGLHDMVRQPYRHGLVDLAAVTIAQVQVNVGDGDGTLMPAKVPTLADIADDEIVKRRTVVLGETRDSRAIFDLAFTIDGESYNPDSWNLDPRLNTAEEWTFVNTTAYPHPMHIHVNPFQVTSINGQPVPERPWYDTHVVPAAGTLTIRSRFTDFDGDFVTHCHILPHEDAGMMMNVRILP